MKFYLNSSGVATKLESITVGAWQRDPSTAMASPQKNSGTPVNVNIEC